MKLFWAGLYIALEASLLPTVARPVSGGPLQVMLTTHNVTCAGQNNGRIEITLLSGVLPVMYEWQNTASGTAGTDGLTSTMPMNSISNLVAGPYRITLTDATGMDTVFFINITEPLPLFGSLQSASNYNGFQVRCADGADGRVQAFINGGTPPYTYQWSSGETAALATALQPGLATLEVRDAQQCSLLLNTLLTSPAPINVTLDVQGEKCLKENNGRIEITQISGGLTPYSFSLSGGQSTYQTLWENLEPGTYFLMVTDANGCTQEEGIVLPTGLEFLFDAGPDREIFTGDTLAVTFGADRPLDSLHFSPSEFVFSSGKNVWLFPRFNTEYQVIAYDDNGCAAEDVFKVEVHRRRDIYTPNVLMPGAAFDDNRFFTIFSGGGVRAVQILQIFDRQGRLVFENRNFPAGQPEEGWDGRWGNDDAPSGVYFWHALIQYTDGRVEKMVGDVTVLR
jgi:hypothetical protein